MNGNTWRIVFVAMLIAAAAMAAPREDIYWSEARGKGGELAYRERHTATFEGERILHSLTEYLSPEGELIATMESDYSLSVAMPTYLFEDLVRGSREGLRREGDDYVIFRQEPGKEEETKVLRETDSVFSCQGWHYFLVENLDLLAQSNLKLDLILPSELKAYTFQVEQV
ncbi:hypothetical protein JXA88_18075, partial [Candidatus Fermentibacteria bacterium]|nr:hypothetical protein [Candidatus Fermentibacteria bacterium]